MVITLDDYDVDEPYNMEVCLWSSMQVGDVLRMDGQTQVGRQPGRVLYFISHQLRSVMSVR